MSNQSHTRCYRFWSHSLLSHIVILYGDPQGFRSISGPVTPHDLTNFFNPEPPKQGSPQKRHLLIQEKIQEENSKECHDFLVHSDQEQSFSAKIIVEDSVVSLVVVV